jgi:beta-lactamase class A
VTSLHHELQIMKPYVSVIAGFGLGIATVIAAQAARAEHHHAYPLLATTFEAPDSVDEHLDLPELRRHLIDYLVAHPDLAPKVSVYVEDLPSRVSMDINQYQESIGASLMKVATVMNLYHLAERGAVDLDKRVALQRDWLDDEFGTLYQKGAGYTLTIREAARLALVDSDNTAALLIWGQIGQFTADSDDVTNYVDIHFQRGDDQKLMLDAASYASLLRCLYFSCFLDRHDSEEVLQYLTESSFNTRLTRFVPDSIRVAHKIGTIAQRTQSDCGIFYLSKSDYLLCVMVNAADPQASDAIAEISREVFEHMTTH